MGVTWKSHGVYYTIYQFDSDIRDKVNELSESDNFHAPLAWAEDIAWIAASIALVLIVSWWFYPLAVLVIGARQRGLSTILHDCSHGSGAANKRLQMFIGTALTAYPIFQQHYAYKASHVFTHHPLLGDPERDPDFRFFMEQKAYALTSRRRYLTRVVLYPALGSQTLAYLRYLVRNRWRMLRKPSALSGPPVPQKKRLLDRCGFWLFWLAVFGLAFWQGQVANLILFWFVPYLTSFQILGWYIELSEHTPMVRDQEVDLYMTRNRRSRGLEKWLTGIHCDDYHLDHHLNPRTPFWKLPEARKIRLADPNYAAVDAKTGGLFTKGPQGQPSALSQIVRALSSKKREDAGCVSS